MLKRLKFQKFDNNKELGREFITQTANRYYIRVFPILLSISFVYQQILWHSFSIWKISKTNTIKFSGCHGPQKIKSWHKKLICTWLSKPVFTINHFGFYWTNNFNLTTPKKSILKKLFSHKVKKTQKRKIKTFIKQQH